MQRHLDITKYYLFRALLKRFILPIVVLYGIDQGLSLSELSIIAGVGSGISLILEIPSGALADTLGHRRTLILSMLGQALSMSLYLGGSFWWILSGTVFYFAAGSLMTGTAEAFFFERVKALGLAPQHAKLYGEGKGFATAVSIVFMLAAGVAYEFYWALPFLIGIVQFILAALVIASIGQTHDTESVKKRERVQFGVLFHIGTAWREVIQEPQIFWMIIASAFVIGPLYAIGDFQQAVMRDVGISVALIGVVYAAKRFLSVIVQAKTHILMKRFRPPTFTAICTVLAIIHFIGLGLIRDPWLLQIPLLIGSLAWVGLEIATNDYVNQAFKPDSRATVLSIKNFVSTLAQLITVGLFGLVTLHASAASGYLIIGAIYGVVLIAPIIKLSLAYRRGVRS